MGLEGWPLAVVLVFAMFAAWASFDSWLKMPYLSRSVGDLKIVARGNKAVDFVIEQDRIEPII